MTVDLREKFLPRLRKKSGSVKVIIIVVAAVAVCAGAGVAGYQKYQQDLRHQREVAAVLDTDRFYSGITVQGVSVGGMTMQQAETAVKAEEPAAAGKYGISVTYNGGNWNFTQADMTFTYDTADVLKKAYAVDRSGDRETRYKQVLALKTKPQKFSITAKLQEDAFRQKVMKIADEIKRDPAEPSVASFSASGGFTFRNGTDGVSVDADKLWADVKAIAEGAHTGTVAVKTSAVPCKTSLADMKSHMKKLGTFSTTSTNNENGTYNMEKALLTANGTVVPAGGTFSFFRRVGSCDQASGYKIAGAIQDGKHIDSYGGGICQSSTTIYGAAIRSGMEVVERYNHSIPSSYCEIGQDATVSYPYADMKVKNTTDYPMYLVTQTSGRKLTATFYGYQPDSYDSISITSQTDKTYPAPSVATYTEDASLAAGVIQMTQRARTGYQASARRIYTKGGKTVKTELLNTSYYPASSAHYSYGKGTDPAKIPGGSSSSKSAGSSSPSSGNVVG